ncbi:hypothetical protein [Boseongicola aestuarii]|uniref:Porin n=1 Tax=Boseongicola aestuarii TaxID=1470561 RepID=A0A238J0C6_9RHOB|nr:hypothetical protein [Boseongicola aestuarii]SMX23625.1 hypothetical protein BOA8489_01735 [Boseongicola aestuarii]
MIDRKNRRRHSGANQASTLRGALVVLAILAPIQAQAQDIRFHGVETGDLLREETLELRFGWHQSNSETTGGTGQQVYESGIAYRGTGEWQLGARVSVYDDPPPAAIGGSLANLSILSIGVEAKRSFIETERLSGAVTASFEGFRYASGLSKSDIEIDTVVGSLHAPVSLSLTPKLRAHIDPAVAFLPDRMNGGDGFGTTAFLGTALSWEATDRVTAYAEATYQVAGRGNTFDASGAIVRDLAWSAGARIQVAPAADLDLYVTNRAGGTMATSGLTLPPNGDQTLFGAQLVYRPGQDREPRPETDQNAVRPPDGLMLRSGAILPLETRRLIASAGTGGAATLGISTSPDTGLQFDVFLERHAEASADQVSVAPGPNRYMLGGRLQLHEPTAALPVWIAAGVFAGRETEPPGAGAFYGELTASKTLRSGYSVRVQPHIAAWGDQRRVGLGLGISRPVSDTLELIGEFSLNGSREDTWATGIRWNRQNALSFTAFATNSIGLQGHGTMIAAKEPRLQVSLERSF